MPRIKLKNVDTGKWEELPLIQGKTGTSITSVEQTTTSTESSGSNVITVTLSDNTSSTFTVRNGAKGDKGDQGEMGSLEDGSVTTEKLADGAITDAKLAQKSVTPLKLADYSVTNVKVADSAIDDRKLARDSVTTEKVVDRAITMRKLAQGSVATSNLIDGAVTSEKIDWTTLDTGWQPLTFSSDVTETGWYDSGARVIGNILFVRCGCVIKKSGWITMATLPTQFTAGGRTFTISHTEVDTIGRCSPDNRQYQTVAANSETIKCLNAYKGDCMVCYSTPVSITFVG